MEKEVRNCVKCNGPVLSKVYWAKFCSAACRIKYHNDLKLEVLRLAKQGKAC